MLSPKQKINEGASEAFDLKRSSGFLLCVLLVFFGIFFASKSISAQIKNLYDDRNDQVAGISSLMSAVANNDIEGVRFFSKAGSALINQKNAGGATALHVACREKNSEIIQILIENGADVNIADNEGWTPLMRASLANDPNTVNLLLQKNAQANSLNSVKESAIIHAASSDCSDCLTAMFEKFNFIKLMDPQLLKDQLSGAYRIAQNHENQSAQDSLSTYLDRAVKMSSLIESDEPVSQVLMSESSDNKILPSGVQAYKTTAFVPVPTDSKKRFRFVSGELPKVKEVKKVDQVNKISLQKKDLPNLTSEAVRANQNQGHSIATYKFLGQKPPIDNSRTLIEKNNLRNSISENSSQETPNLAQEKLIPITQSLTQAPRQLTLNEKICQFFTGKCCEDDGSLEQEPQKKEVLEPVKELTLNEKICKFLTGSCESEDDEKLSEGEGKAKVSYVLNKAPEKIRISDSEDPKPGIQLEKNPSNNLVTRTGSLRIIYKFKQGEPAKIPVKKTAKLYSLTKNDLPSGVTYKLNKN